MSTVDDKLLLDELMPLQTEIGYGQLGRSGALGYDGGSVSVNDQAISRALSAHAPSRLVYELDGSYNYFHCQVALNGDVPAGASRASFHILADGRLVALHCGMIAGSPPRALQANIAGCRRLELITETDRWAYCHTLWLYPVLSRGSVDATGTTLTDCLNRVQVQVPQPPLHSDICIATVVTPGYEPLLDDMLATLRANGGCPEALIVVFAVDTGPAVEKVIYKHGAIAVRCRLLVPANQTVKSILYSVAQFVNAHKYLCLDADTLIMDDLTPLLAAIDAFPNRSLLVCRDAYLPQSSLVDVLSNHYAGRAGDLQLLLEYVAGEGAYSFIINDGMFAGGKEAMLMLDCTIRCMEKAPRWVDERSDHRWRNQFVFNLALAHLDCAVELDATCNLQLHMHDVQWQENGCIQALWHGRVARVLHFCGWGRNKYPEWRRRVTQAALEILRHSGSHPAVAQSASDDDGEEQ